MQPGDDGVLTDLGTLPGDGFSIVTDANDAGLAVGWSAPALFFFGPSTAVKWDASGIHSLGTLPGDLDSAATGVNARGVIVGTSGDMFLAADGFQHAVLWDRDGIRELPALSGDNWTNAAAVNDAGVVIGQSAFLEGDPFVTQFGAFGFPVRWVRGVPEALPLLPGDTAGVPFAINADGVIVGASILGDEFGFLVESHPVMWVDGEVIDLNAALGDASWILTNAGAINDRGQIAGNGLHDGVLAGFRMTPAGRRAR